MRMTKALIVATLVGLFGAGDALAASEMGIITGGEKGTYYQFGLNLRELAKRNEVALNVHPSQGSIENIMAVYQRKGVQLGIVQSDVLAFVARVQSDESLKRIARKTRMVFPLYNEEIHVLGRGITAFEDLANRRVAIGREGSGTYLTARLLLNLADVAPQEMLLSDTDEALGQLKAGRIDAMFYVAGAPVKLFKESVTEADGLSLVPIANKSIGEFYVHAQIPAGTYAWQPGAVETVAVKSVLVSFDFRRADCDNVGKMAKAIADNMPWLIEHGHPKWKNVDLQYPLRGWEQYDCVKKYLGKAIDRPKEAPGAAGNPVSTAIRRILGD